MAEADAAAAATGDASGDKFFMHTGPQRKTKYPAQVIYCEVCDDWPLEYCEYHPNYAKAKEWMEMNLTEDLKGLYLSPEDGTDDSEGGKKKRQTRGGRGVIKTKKKAEVDRKVSLSRAPRGKKKYVTVVVGLGTYDVDLKQASKLFASKFSCGSSVTGDDEIVIQGDVKDDLYDFIPEKWPQIDEDDIDDKGDQKRS